MMAAVVVAVVTANFAALIIAAVVWGVAIAVATANANTALRQANQMVANNLRGAFQDCADAAGVTLTNNGNGRN